MKKFDAKKTIRSCKFHLQAAPDVIFPLLCPVREEEWVAGWDNKTYELVYSKSGFNEEGCIFRTAYPEGNDAVWVCLMYDKQTYTVEFLVYVTELMIRKMQIHLITDDNGMTDAIFEYSLTAITEKGNSIVDAYSDQAHLQSVSGLGMMINHFLKNGKKMTLPG